MVRLDDEEPAEAAVLKNQVAYYLRGAGNSARTANGSDTEQTTQISCESENVYLDSKNGDANGVFFVLVR